MLNRHGRASRCIDKIKASASGAAAIEFVFIVPVLALLLLGVSDYIPSFVARYKSSHANGSFGDLVAQSSALQSTDVATYYTAASQVVSPFPSAPLLLRISNIYSDGQGHAYVYWSCGQAGMTPLAAKSAVTAIPNGTAVSDLLQLNSTTYNGKTYSGANTSFVMVESQYTYTAPAQFVLKGVQTMKSLFVDYPRQSAYIGFPWDGNANDAPPQPTSTTRTNSLTLSNGATCNYAM